MLCRTTDVSRPWRKEISASEQWEMYVGKKKQVGRGGSMRKNKCFFK